MYERKVQFTSVGQIIIINDSYTSNLKFRVNKVMPLIFILFGILSYFCRVWRAEIEKEKCKIKIYDKKLV